MRDLPVPAKRCFKSCRYVSFVLLLIVLVSCVQQRYTLLATPANGVSVTVQSTPENAASPRPLPRPILTAVPPSSAPTPIPTSFVIDCNLNGPYLGISNPGSVSLDLINVTEDCRATLPSSRSRAQTAFGSWLPSGSGFLYLDGFKQGGKYSIDICVWDLKKQTTINCLVENGDNYLKAAWSPSANYVAYGRMSNISEQEYITVADAESNDIIYETERSILAKGISQRFLAWHPSRKQILVAEGNDTIQTAILVDVETGARHDLVEFDGKNDFIVKGLWVQNGSAIFLGVIAPSMCCNLELTPEARDLYFVLSDGTGLKQLLKDAKVGRFMEDAKYNRLLIDTYSNSGPDPMYWLSLERGAMARVFDDNFEKAYPILKGITPDGRYIVVVDGQYQTWLFDVETQKFRQLDISVLSPIYWRP